MKKNNKATARYRLLDIWTDLWVEVTIDSYEEGIGIAAQYTKEQQHPTALYDSGSRRLTVSWMNGNALIEWTR